jgi:uncharacterized membrane protein YcjF (UPF0283 family)
MQQKLAVTSVLILALLAGASAVIIETHAMTQASQVQQTQTSSITTVVSSTTTSSTSPATSGDSTGSTTSATSTTSTSTSILLTSPTITSCHGDDGNEHAQTSNATLATSSSSCDD